jgi:hypothetical protein
MATAKPVEQWGLNEAKEAAALDLPLDYEVNRKLIEDKDAWQNGTLWPGFRTGDPSVDKTILANVKPQFVSDDIVGEGVGNRSAGLVGQEADITLVLLVDGEPDPEAALDDAAREEIDAVIRALSAWWDRVGLWPLVRRAIDRVSYATRGSVRCFVPSGKLVGTALPTAATLAEALAQIELDAPLPNQANRYTDPLTSQVSSITIRKINDKESAEVWTIDPKNPLQITLRILGEGAGNFGPFDTRGRLPLAVAKGERIVTPSVQTLQSQLNFITTITTRVVETAGNRERYLGNVDPPGMWLPYPPANGPALEIDSETTPGTIYYKHRVPYILGANITTELQGLPVRRQAADGSQEQTYMTPSVEALDPVDPVYATDAAKVITARIYKRMRQGHLAGESTAEASGTAYQQARAQFEGDLDALKSPVELMLRDLLEAVLAWAGLMHSASATLLDRYRVQVTLHPVSGPILADEQRLAVELRDKRAISQSTMLARLGSEDVVAEQDLIDADPLQNASRWTALALAINAMLAMPGMSVEGAGFLLKLSVDDVLVLLTGVPPAESEFGQRAAEIAAAVALAATLQPAPTASGNGTGGGVPNNRPAFR